MWIFRTWITRKDGTKDYAKDHGKKAFRFWVLAALRHPR